MTVIENINIAYVSQDLSLLSSADADGTKAEAGRKSEEGEERVTGRGRK